MERHLVSVEAGKEGGRNGGREGGGGEGGREGGRRGVSTHSHKPFSMLSLPNLVDVIYE